MWNSVLGVGSVCVLIMVQHLIYAGVLTHWLWGWTPFFVGMAIGWLCSKANLADRLRQHE